MRSLPYATAGLPRRCAPRNDNGGGGNLRSGFASVILAYVAPLLLLLETDTEAKGVAEVDGRVAAALGGAQVRPSEVPTATA